MLGILLWGSCKEENTRIGLIQAAINSSCGGAINFQGDHVFAYMETSGAYSGELLVGGYPFDETKEFGMHMPWPPAAGTYDIASTGISIYYDPDDRNNSDADQFGSISGNVQVVSVELNGDKVNQIDVRFDDVQLMNGSGSSLCLDDGKIAID